MSPNQFAKPHLYYTVVRSGMRYLTVSNNVELNLVNIVLPEARAKWLLPTCCSICRNRVGWQLGLNSTLAMGWYPPLHFRILSSWGRHTDIQHFTAASCPLAYAPPLYLRDKGTFGSQDVLDYDTPKALSTEQSRWVGVMGVVGWTFCSV